MSGCFVFDETEPPPDDPQPDPVPEPPPRLPTDPPFPVYVSGSVRSIAVDGGYLYAARGVQLLRVSLADGTVDSLAILDADPDHLLLVDGYLYFKEGSLAIARLSTQSPDDIEVIVDGEIAIESFAVGTAYIYYADRDNGALYRATNGPAGVSEKLLDVPDDQLQAGPIRLAIDDAAAYAAIGPSVRNDQDTGDVIVELGRIVRIDRATGVASIVLSGSVDLGELVVIDSRMYWTRPGGIDTALTNGSDFSEFQDVFSPNELVVDDTHLYWIDNGRLYRGDRQTGLPRLVASSPGLTNLDVIGDDRNLYATYFDGGQTRIFRIPKSAL